MFKSIAKHPFRSLFIVLGVIALVCLTLSWVLTQAILAEPLCDNWKVGMTREEKVLLSVKTVNDLYKPRFKIIDTETGNVHFKTEKQIPYKNAGEILVKYPECCKLYSTDTARTDNPSEEIFEGDEGIVYVNYIGRYKDSSGKIHKAPIALYADLNPCKNRSKLWFRH